MSKVSVANTVREVIDDLGPSFIDLVKSAKSICIVSTGSDDATQVVIDAIEFHGRASIHVLNSDDEVDIVESTIFRGDEVRMPIRRPRSLIDTDAVIVIAPMLADRARRTALSIEQYLFATWYVPERRAAQGFVRSHEPWLEGDSRDVVLADIYAQRPIDLAILDGSAATAGIVLASFDAVAIDSVGAHMNGLIPEDIGYLSSLAAQGIGVCTLSKIDVPLGIISR